MHILLTYGWTSQIKHLDRDELLMRTEVALFMHLASTFFDLSCLSQDNRQLLVRCIQSTESIDVALTLVASGLVSITTNGNIEGGLQHCLELIETTHLSCFGRNPAWKIRNFSRLKQYHLEDWSHSREGCTLTPAPKEELECLVCWCCSSPVFERGSKQLCAACGVVAYCGRECQKSDWKTHKHLCGHLRAAASEIHRIGDGGISVASSYIKWQRGVEHWRLMVKGYPKIEFLMHLLDQVQKQGAMAWQLRQQQDCGKCIKNKEPQQQKPSVVQQPYRAATSSASAKELKELELDQSIQEQNLKLSEVRQLNREKLRSQYQPTETPPENIWNAIPSVVSSRNKIKRDEKKTKQTI